MKSWSRLRTKKNELFSCNNAQRVNEWNNEQYRELKQKMGDYYSKTQSINLCQYKVTQSNNLISISNTNIPKMSNSLRICSGSLKPLADNCKLIWRAEWHQVTHQPQMWVWFVDKANFVLPMSINWLQFILGSLTRQLYLSTVYISKHFALNNWWIQSLYILEQRSE